MAKTYIVKGGQPLHGQTQISGSRNTVTKMMAASLLSGDPVRLNNVPDIGEVDSVEKMLESFGAQITWDKQNRFLHLSSPDVVNGKIEEGLSGKNRLPILLVAPLLHRLGEVTIPIGKKDEDKSRPIDFHIEGFRAMGAEVKETESSVLFSAKKLKGASITLPYPSVMATENLMMAATLAEGKTIIKNVAVEPEIVDLMNLLQKMGAIIFHDPGRIFVIEGVKYLHGAEHTILSDRIEVASFACAALATRGSVFLKGASQDDMRTFMNMVKKAGGSFEVRENGISFSHVGELKAVNVETGVHPGFMTDWQPPFATVMTQAEGTSVIHETVYEQRLGYLETLKKMGADAEVFTDCLGGDSCRFKETNQQHSAVIKGPVKLNAAEMEIPDSRAGFAYLIAALAADGETKITGMEKLERGYENLVERLNALGAEIKEA